MLNLLVEVLLSLIVIIRFKADVFECANIRVIRRSEAIGYKLLVSVVVSVANLQIIFGIYTIRLLHF